ncbi:serine hydrolase domain-containing protein [Sorangium sp. So ce136]|uniref:serine hydrolase domain-containing protein n=1 Tax=Sorangium sp. So ce136 TaxID=3133284 RepID=UPI003F01045B
MMRHRPCAALIALTLLAPPVISCGGAEPAAASVPRSPRTAAPTGTSGAPAPSSAPEAPPGAVTITLDVDTRMTTTTGATFTASSGWTATTSRDLVLLVEPDREATVAFVDTSEPDLEKAIAAAWKLKSPGFARQVKQTMKPPARDGGEGVVRVDYETPRAEHRVIFAIARRKGDTTYITLVDATEAGFGRRAAQAKMMFESMRAAGMEEESFRGKKARAFDAAGARALEGFIVEGIRKSKIPGAAVAVVQGGKIVYTKGFGVRAAGKKEPVTPDTLFMIGSITKSLTTLMMAAVVDAGKMSWDTPVTQIYPSFALGDTDATKMLTMKHTACACTGLPRQDMDFFFGYVKATPESRIEQMHATKLTTGFGETFQYSNSMASAGGYIAAHALYPDRPLGQAYDLAMKEKVFDAIGMKSTTFDRGAASRGNHALPHGATIELDHVAAPLKAEDWVSTIRPAGGAWSNVNDMARYVMVELRKGKTPEGKQVVSEANLTRRYQPMVKVGDRSAYGLGLGIEDRHGVEVFWHDGGTLGFRTVMLFMPEQDTGFVLLTNADGGWMLADAAQRRLLELLFDGKQEAAQNLDFSLERRAEEIAIEVAKLERAPQKEWVDRIATVYQNDVLGKITVAWRGGHALVDTGEWKSGFGVSKESDGTEKLVLIDSPYVGWEFLLAKQGDKRTLTLETAQQKHVFIETEPAADGAGQRRH